MFLCILKTYLQSCSIPQFKSLFSNFSLFAANCSRYIGEDKRPLNLQD